MPQKPKFLVTDLVPEGCFEILAHLGFEVDHIEDLSNDHLKKIIGLYTGLVVRTSLEMNAEMLDAAKNLKYILRPGSGLDNIDVPYAESKGIFIFNSPEANKDAVAEHVIGMLLGLMNFIPRASQQVFEGKWIRKPNTGTLLKGKTVGIIGYGHTGKALAAKLKGFEVRILAYDKYIHDFDTPGITESSMEDIFGQADVLSVHLPLTPETKNMVNAAFLHRFHKPIYFINTSRGGIVETDALISGLEQGILLGAGIDVLENENLPSYTETEKNQFNKLMAAGNILITPHIAGWTHESRDAIFTMVVEKFRNYMAESQSAG